MAEEGEFEEEEEDEEEYVWEGEEEEDLGGKGGGADLDDDEHPPFDVPKLHRQLSADSAQTVELFTALHGAETIERLETLLVTMSNYVRLGMIDEKIRKRLKSSLIEGKYIGSVERELESLITSQSANDLKRSQMAAAASLRAGGRDTSAVVHRGNLSAGSEDEELQALGRAIGGGSKNSKEPPIGLLLNREIIYDQDAEYNTALAADKKKSQDIKLEKKRIADEMNLCRDLFARRLRLFSDLKSSFEARSFKPSISASPFIKFKLNLSGKKGKIITMAIDEPISELVRYCMFFVLEDWAAEAATPKLPQQTVPSKSTVFRLDKLAAAGGGGGGGGGVGGVGSTLPLPSSSSTTTGELSDIRAEALAIFSKRDTLPKPAYMLGLGFRCSLTSPALSIFEVSADSLLTCPQGTLQQAGLDKACVLQISGVFVDWPTSIPPS